MSFAEHWWLSTWMMCLSIYFLYFTTWPKERERVNNVKRTGQSANKGDSGSSLIQQIRAATDSRELERTELLQRCLLLRPVILLEEKTNLQMSKAFDISQNIFWGAILYFGRGCRWQHTYDHAGFLNRAVRGTEPSQGQRPMCWNQRSTRSPLMKVLN